MFSLVCTNVNHNYWIDYLNNTVKSLLDIHNTSYYFSYSTLKKIYFCNGLTGFSLEEVRS